MRNNNDSEPKAPRGAKRFEEKFEKLRLAYKSAEDDKIDDLLADLAKLLRSSQPLCSYFLLNCNDDQMRFAILALDEVAEEFCDVEFLATLKQAQRRFPLRDLTSAMDAVAYAVAEEAFKKDSKREKTLTDRVKATAKLKIHAEDGDPEAQYLLALRYYFGSVGGPNYAEARKWADIAIENGCVAAEIVRDLPREG